MRRVLLAMGTVCLVAAAVVLLVVAPQSAPSGVEQLTEAMRADATGTPMADLDDPSGTWRIVGWVAGGLGVVLLAGGFAARE